MEPLTRKFLFFCMSPIKGMGRRIEKGKERVNYPYLDCTKKKGKVKERLHKQYYFVEWKGKEMEIYHVHWQFYSSYVKIKVIMSVQ